MINSPNLAEARCRVVLSFDVDGETAFLDDPQALTRPSLLSMGRYGRGAGLDRILRMLEVEQLSAQFFVPGYVAEFDRTVTERILAAGHPIGHHGYKHESLVGVDPVRERDIFIHGLEALEDAMQRRPKGYRAPQWETTPSTMAILTQHGICFDSSLMGQDEPYVVEHAEGSVFEFPVHWSLDDWEQYAFIPGGSPPNVIATPDKLMTVWRSIFDAVYSDSGYLCFTMHPQLTGRPGRTEALREFIQYMRSRDGVVFSTLDGLYAHYQEGAFANVAKTDIFHGLPSS